MTSDARQTTEVRKARDWRVRRQCSEAEQLQNAGDYEGARTALSGVWTVIGRRPALDLLGSDTQAELLLRVGALSGRLGSALQVGGAQEFAKDLLTESVRLFEALGDQDKMAEAQSDLALCYWREGAFEEARVLFIDALSNARSSVNQARTLLSRTTIEFSSGQYQQALATLRQAALLMDDSSAESLKGSYHAQLASVHEEMGQLDAALIEYSAASLHLALAGHSRHLAVVENNIGFTLLQLGQPKDALFHLDQARRIFVNLRDAGRVAQVNETRARVLIAQNRYADAERAAFAAVSTLEHGGEQSLLAEALTTQGVALARMAKHQKARTVFERAVEITQVAGDTHSSGRTYLTMIEELQSFLASGEAARLLLDADKQLGNDLDSETVAFLRRCMRVVVDSVRGTETTVDDILVGGSRKDELRHLDAQLIKRALDQANGSITRAARILGISHQGLAWSLEHRHKNLLRSRNPPRIRRKTLIKLPRQ